MPETAALITGLILERPLCLACLGAKSNLDPATVDRTLATIARVMRLDRGPQRCRACGDTKEAVSVSRPT